MKRPWHYWTVFLFALAIVLAAMTWLTYMALELDHAEIAARQQAELEEDISRALWRMEVKLVPILAKEAARPHSVYRPILSGADWSESIKEEQATATPVELSPLLTDRSDYVLLNFEVGPTNVWSSPQSLTGPICTLACSNGASLEEIEQCTERLDALKETVEYRSLFEKLPEDASIAWRVAADNPGASREDGEPHVVSNNRLDLNPLQQQALQQQVLEDSQPNLQTRGSTRAIANTYANRRDMNRRSNDLSQRAAALQNYSRQELAGPRTDETTVGAIREGVSRPIWVGSELLFARRVEYKDDVRIQGCVLNWPKIKQQLLDEVVDLLPRIDIEPVSQLEQVNVTRMLAALPAQLVVASPVVPRVAWSPMRVSLMIVWVCLLVVFLGAGVVLHGVLLLSERRGAFVSAVTHELRTPLTTFRMYSEMLARDMVPDPERRRAYLETLRREADRLSHLVENVLAYARLERGPSGRGREQLSVEALLARMTDRFAERAEQAEMRFGLEVSKSVGKRIIATDPAAVEQILFNLVDNACKYASSASDRRIRLEVRAVGNLLQLAVHDFGKGISPRQSRRLFRPFSKGPNDATNPAPGVGLGLALCRRLARELGGRLNVATKQQDGAMFILELPVGADEKNVVD